MGSVTVKTDKSRYTSSQKTTGTVYNNTNQAIYLDACSIFERQRTEGAG